MQNSLVVLTDFFAVSNRALSYAAGLAVPLKANLVLLHVRHNGLLSPAEYATQHGGPSEGQTRRALYQLAESQPVPTQVEVAEGFLPEAVGDTVRHYQPQLLVLGRPGPADTPAEVVVSAALDLLRHVPYPLLAVDAVGWGRYPPRRIAVALDGNDFTLYEHETIVRQLVDCLQATLCLIYVSDHSDRDRDPGLDVLHTARINGLAPVPADAGPHIVYHPHTAEGILQGVAEVDADLLVLVARRHSLLGGLFHRSVTAQLIGHSPVPLLVLPAQE